MIDDILTSVAGPVSNFVIAMALFTLLMILKSVSAEGASMVRDVADFSGERLLDRRGDERAAIGNEELQQGRGRQNEDEGGH